MVKEVIASDPVAREVIASDPVTRERERAATTTGQDAFDARGRGEGRKGLVWSLMQVRQYESGWNRRGEGEDTVEGWTAALREEGARAATDLRLAGRLVEAVERLRALKGAGVEQARTLVEFLGEACKDPECAREIGNAWGHLVLKRAAVSSDPPWDDDRVQALVADAISNALCSLGSLVSAPAIGALDNRPRPFVVEFDDNLEVILRQVSEQVAEIGTGERANVRVGFRLWGGALVLANTINQLGKAGVWRGKSILEIGSGLGLCGLAAGREEFGAKHVCLSDFHPRIVENLQYNVGLNVRTNNVEKHRCIALDWEQLDDDLLDTKYDFVVGSDLVCEPADCVLVAKVLDKTLSDSGVAYITLGSQESRYGVDSFQKVLEEHGFRLTTKSVEIPPVCLPPSAATSDSIDQGIFIGTAKSYLHFEVRR